MKKRVRRWSHRSRSQKQNTETETRRQVKDSDTDHSFTDTANWTKMKKIIIILKGKLSWERWLAWMERWIALRLRSV